MEIATSRQMDCVTQSLIREGSNHTGQCDGHSFVGTLIEWEHNFDSFRKSEQKKAKAKKEDSTDEVRHV